MSSAARPPLQAILLTDAGHADSRKYEAAAALALHGGKDAAGYLPPGDDLSVQFRTYSSTADLEAPGDMKARFRHTLVAVLWTSTLATSPAPEIVALRTWLEQFAELATSDPASHRLLPLGFEEEALAAVGSSYPKLARIQSAPTHAFGEYALRPAILRFACCTRRVSWSFRPELMRKACRRVSCGFSSVTRNWMDCRSHALCGINSTSSRG